MECVAPVWCLICVRAAMIRFLSLSCLALLLASPALTQSISGGTIGGVVKDPSSAMVPGARVTLRNAVTSYEQTVQSDAEGASRSPTCRSITIS